MKKYKPTRLRRGEGKVRCVDVRGNQLCVFGHKYGFEGRLYAKGHFPDSANFLPVAVGRARTATDALRAGKKFLRKVS